MDDATRAIAWAIAEAWWRKTHRQAAGPLPAATSSRDYADRFWQGFCDEAQAAAAVIAGRAAPAPSPHRVASDRFV